MSVVVFPAESVPDGNIWLPHHFVMGAWGALFVSWLLSTDGEKPWLMVGGLVVALFGWYHVWPTGMPVIGAILVLVGLTAATVALRRPLWREESDWKVRGLALVFLLIAWDDTFSHAFGVYTPLDRLWTLILAPLIV